MPATRARSILSLACLLPLQGCLIPTGEKWATAEENGPPYVPTIPYAFVFPGAGDTLVAGTAAMIKWIPKIHPKGPAELSLWKDSALILDHLASAPSDSGSMPWAVPWGLPAGRYRLRLAAGSDPQLIAFSLPFATAPAAPDSFEAGDALGTAHPIGTDGVPQARNLLPQDTDWIAFTARPGKRYLAEFRMNGTAHLAWTDSAGAPLRAGPGPARDPNGINPVDPAYAGRHYLRLFADTSSPLGFGPYRIAIREYDPEGSPYAIAFSSPAADSVWSAGSSHTVRWIPDSAVFRSTVVLSLYRDTSSVFRFMGLGGEGSEYVTLPALLPSGSRYRIRIDAFPGSTNAPVFAYGPYFAIAGILPDAYEPDDSRGTAKPIALGGSAQARSVALGDTDWVRFEGEAGASYYAGARFPAQGYALQLTDGLGSVLAASAGGTAPVAFTAVHAGAYYLKAFATAGARGEGAYALSLSRLEAMPDGLPIRFSAPDFGAGLRSGATFTLDWSTDSTLFADYFDVGLYRRGEWVETLAWRILDNGSATVALPEGLEPGTDYRLRLTWSGAPSVYGSSPAFAILP